MYINSIILNYLCVKNKFGLSYKDVSDEDYQKVIEYIDFLKKNPN